MNNVDDLLCSISCVCFKCLFREHGFCNDYTRPCLTHSMEILAVNMILRGDY